ncbi:MAG: hypothetical protein K6B41_15415 [Butyrivibrio sp.]|nr:hypothetical protein [Butyrivibrio sp.]
MENISIEKLYSIYEKGIDRVFRIENFEGFIDALWQLYNQPLENIVLLWMQNKNVSEVAGIRKWKDENISIKKDEKGKGMVVLYPTIQCIDPGKLLEMERKVALDKNESVIYEIEPEFKAELKAVTVYDISQTDTKRVEDLRPDINIEDRLREGNIKIAEIEDLPVSENEGFVSGDIFYIKKNLHTREEEYDRVLLNLYIEMIINSPNYCNDNSPEDFEILMFLAQYCLQKYFFGKSNISLKIVRIKAEKLTHEEKKRQLRALLSVVCNAIQFFNGSILTFGETGIINSLFDTGSMTELEILMDRAMKSVGNFFVLCNKVQRSDIGVMSEASIESIKTKLIVSKKGFIPELYRLKLKHKVIYTAPPVKIPVMID